MGTINYDAESAAMRTVIEERWKWSANTQRHQGSTDLWRFSPKWSDQLRDTTAIVNIWTESYVLPECKRTLTPSWRKKLIRAPRLAVVTNNQEQWVCESRRRLSVEILKGWWDIQLNRGSLYIRVLSRRRIFKKNKDKQFHANSRKERIWKHRGITELKDISSPETLQLMAE